MMWRTALKKPLKPNELRQLQNQKLRALITHSYANVPYYRHLFQKNGLHPDDIETVDDLPKIPVTRKTDIRDLPVDEVIASGYKVDQCRIFRTSGTTGIPLTIYRDRKAELMTLLTIARSQLECGDKITNKTIDLGSGMGLPLNHPLQKVGIFRKKWVSPFIDVKAQIDEIKAYDPRSLISYPTLLEELAKEIIEGDVRGLNIQLVFSGGEHMDEPTRALIHKALDAEVFNFYGNREVNRVSSECVQHHGLHIFAESNLIEIIQDGEPVQIGDEGEVTVTNLYNYAMPFIRYATDDIGMLLGSDCTCGNCAPLMQITEGRKKDRIWLPGGRMVAAAIPIEVMRYIEGLRQFKLVQEAYDRFLVRIVPDRRMDKTALDAIRDQLIPILGDVKITIEEVENIPRERSGKLLQFTSNIQTV